MSATSRRETSPAPAKTAVAALGLVGVDVDLQRGCVADHEHAVADLPRAAPMNGVCVEVVAGDREVRAVAIGRGFVLGVRDRARARVVLELGRLGAAQRGDDAGEDDRDPVAAGVDDAGLPQHRQQVGPALDAGLPRPRSRARGSSAMTSFCSSGVARRGRAGCRRHVRELGGARGGHLAHHGEHRALSRLAHRAVRAVGGARHRRADQHRVDELAGAARSAPPRRRGCSCERMTPLLPRAPSSAARATDSTISSRPISSIVRSSPWRGGRSPRARRAA